MADLRIQVYKIGNAEPETTVRIPGGVLKFAATIIPKLATDALREKGVDLEEIIRMTSTSGVSGTLVEVEDHQRNERIVISVD